MKVRKEEPQGRFGEEELVGMGLWFVAEDYRCEPPGRRIHPVGRASWFRVPLRDPDLFLSFARLGAGDGPDEGAVLEWVRKHGLLRRAMEGNPYRHFVEDGWEKVNQAPMTVEEFRSEAAQAYRALTLFEQIRGEDFGALRQRLRREVAYISQPIPVDGSSGTEVRWEKLPEASVSLDGEFVRRVEPGLRTSGAMMAPLDEEIPDALLIAQAVVGLQQIVEEKLMRVELRFTQHVRHPRPLSTIAGSLPFRPRLTWRCPDLESALWFQFAALMEDKRPLCVCEGCGQLFFQRRPDMRVCGPTCRKKKQRKRTDKRRASG